MSAEVDLKWIEFRPRPKKDGLHDSGYRFIQLTGVDKNLERHDLGEWHDHFIVEPRCNIDVTEDGVIRIMPWSSEGFRFNPDQPFFYSTAWVTEGGGFR